MPAKKNFLPQPCPKCGQKNGTVQIVIFAEDYHNVYCRILHYSAKEYKNPREKVISKIEVETAETRSRDKPQHKLLREYGRNHRNTEVNVRTCYF